jgi:inosine-uridine nucleoside N-ribohydrolase
MFSRRPSASVGPRPLLIDTDTGVDDALALCLAFRSPEVEVVGITTVAGNVEVERCTRNVRALVDRLQIAHPPRIVSGALRPSALPLVTAPEVHGQGGMGTLTPVDAPPVRGSARRAAEFIATTADRFGSALTIVAVGPLTNLAEAYRLAPGAMKHVGRVISMGGAFHVPGNTGPVAEFNYFVDPHAVATVVRQATRLLIVPLDVTEQITLMWTDVARRTVGGDRRWMRRLLRGYMDYHRATEGFHGAFLHDPVAVAEAICPGLLYAEPVNVEIVDRDGPARGMTTEGTIRHVTRGRVWVARGICRPTFFRLFNRIWADA